MDFDKGVIRLQGWCLKFQTFGATKLLEAIS
jgi:hypothetical protein